MNSISANVPFTYHNFAMVAMRYVRDLSDGLPESSMIIQLLANIYKNYHCKVKAEYPTIVQDDVKMVKWIRYLVDNIKNNPYFDELSIHDMYNQGYLVQDEKYSYPEEILEPGKVLEFITSKLENRARIRREKRNQ